MNSFFPNSNDFSTKRFLIASLIIVFAGMAICEICNTLRIWSTPQTVRKFPYEYVSKGIYSAGAFVRPLDSYNTDIEPGLQSTLKLLHGNENLYSQFQLSGSSFIYPPSAAVIMAPFGITAHAAGNTILATKLVDLTGRVCVAITLILALFVFRQNETKLKWLLVTALTLLAFYPIRWMLTCVQVQSLITALLVIAIVFYAQSRSFIAGLLIGIAACLKPHLAILAVFACFRKDWQLLLAMLISPLIVIATSLYFSGLAPWIEYLSEIMPIMSTGYAFYPNQSVNGIVHRWLGHDPVFTFGPGTAIISFATNLNAIIFTLIAVCPRILTRRYKQTVAQATSPISVQFFSRITDIGIALLAVTLASPIAWEHHFTWTIVLFSACTVIAMNISQLGKYLPVLAISYVLMGTYFLPIKTASAGWLSLLNSPGFAGAIILLVTVWILHTAITNTKQVWLRTTKLEDTKEKTIV
jgi:hypothetical protein